MIEMIVIALGAIIFCSLAYLSYRVYKNYYIIRPEIVTVSLRTNRSALIAEQRKVVSERRRQIKGKIAVAKPEQQKPLKEEGKNSEPADSMDGGFGENLGLAIEQTQEKSASTLVERRRSRFADMRNAAEELRDIYKRNSKIE